MLSSIRAFAKSWFAWIIFGALLVSFGLISPNVRDSIVPSFDTSVVNAGGRKVEPLEFKRIFEGYKSEQDQRAQRTITMDEVVQHGFDRMVLSDLAAQESLAQQLGNLGLRPSDKLVASEVQKVPAFFNPVTGAFDQKKYSDLLRDKGLTPAVFQQGLRDQIAGAHFAFGASQGLLIPRVYTALFASYAYEARDGAYFAIDARTAGPIPTPTDAELQDFLNKSGKLLPEFRVLSVVRFSSKAAAATAKIDEADVQKRFNFAKDTLSTPEKRTFIQIPVKDQAAAATVAARLRKGEDPGAVAKAMKVDPVLFADKPKSAIGDQRLAEAAFKLAENQVSDPIQGDLTWGVIKVTVITPGHEATLAEARPKIEEAARAAAGQKIAYDQSDKFQNAHGSGSNFAQSAQKAGVAVLTLGPVSAQGIGQNGKPVEGVDPKLLASAFALPQGGESDSVEEAGDGEWYAVRVEKVIAPAPPALADIKAELTAYLQQQTLIQRLNAKAQDLQTRIRAGEPLEKAAASVNAQVVHVVGIDRISAQSHIKDLGQQFLEAMIQAKAGEVFVAQAAPPRAALLIAKVDAVRQGDMAPLAQFTVDKRTQFSQTYFEELVGQARTQAATLLKTKSNLDRARAAIGITPEQVAALDPTKPATGKPKK